jgi:hypothetical protein
MMIVKGKWLVIAILAVFLAVPVFAASFINNTGGASILGNVSLGTTESKGQLHINGSVYQNQLTPRIVGNITDGSRLNASRNVFVSGRYAYVVASDNDSFSIIDVSSPSLPTIVGYVTDSTQLISPSYVAAYGKYAYAASGSSNNILVIDVFNASSPVITSVLSASYIGGDIYASGRYLYSLSSTGGSTLSVVDISNPHSLRIAGNVTDTRLAGTAGIFVSGRYAYVAASTNDSLSIIDVSDPSSPLITGSVTDVRLNSARAAYVSGRYAYVTSFLNDSLSVIDVSNVTSPAIVGHITDFRLNSARDVQVAGRYAYVTATDNDSLVILDVSNATSPTITGLVTDPLITNGASGLSVSGKYAYVASVFSNSLSIIDISGIDSPAASIGAVETGSLHVTENAVVANDLYVGNGVNVGPGGLYSQGRVAIYSASINNTNASLLSVGNSTPFIVATFGNGQGKIDVGTIDPVYTINGKQCATYMPAMTGVKEETTGVASLECSDGLCTYVIDFNSLEEGSDLWLFAKTTNLKKNMDKMSVLLTPSFKGRAWYEKDGSKISIFARRMSGISSDVSYRLTAPRFDHEKWTNYNNGGSTGFIIE